jgi:tRNA (guanine37-N1)-methyltransferase
MNTLQFHIITLFPEMFSALNYGIIGRAQQSGLLSLQFLNPRDFTDHKNRRVDESPYGGGPGMVMQAKPLRQAIYAAKKACPEKTKVIYLSPQGKRLTQEDLITFLPQQRFIFLCGRYEGIDQRVIENDVDEEWSIGDYILSGGEFAAMILIDAMTRLHPDALGDPESAHHDSFTDGLLEYPQYTRPEAIDGQCVPAVLLGGNHEAIRQWRLEQSLGNTWLKRPDLLKDHSLNDEEKVLLKHFIEKRGRNHEPSNSTGA